MQKTLEPLCEALRDIATTDGLPAALRSFRDRIEVDHLAYRSVISTGQPYAVQTYPPEWVDRYAQQDYARIDPVVQGCFRRFSPVDWKNLDWSTRAARAYLAEAIAAGVGNQGYSVPIRGPNGQFAILTANHSCDDAHWQRFITLRHDVLNQKALVRERGTDHIPQPSLSPREVDALTLLAQGHSRAQASGTLSISEHTLRVYVESARHKLGAANTTHAVARAMARGLLVV